MSDVSRNAFVLNWKRENNEDIRTLLDLDKTRHCSRCFHYDIFRCNSRSYRTPTHLQPEHVEGLGLVHQPVGNFLFAPLGLEGAEHAVPND